MKKYLINLLVGITGFFLLTETSFAETTMSEEGPVSENYEPLEE